MIKTIIIKITSTLCIAGVLMVANLPLLNAFEAHVIGVTAEIKNDIPESPALLITKVYYDVDSEHCELCQEWKSEWVEIYNPTNSPVNISGWFIADNSGSDTILPKFCDSSYSPACSIPAGGYAVITGKSTTWKYWDIPADVVKIVLDDPIGGDGLDNNDDRVILFNPNGTKVDAMSYGGDTYIFNPSCPDAAEGSMLGRIPLDPGPGYQDTGAASDWKDYELPQISNIKIYQYQYGGLISPNGDLYGNRPATIKWTAVNPNGDNGDLLIDIFFIIDDGGYNNTGIITESDSVYLIGENLANPAIGEGSYYWSKVSPSYLGWVWFKVVAKGPENFMIVEDKISYRVYEPPAPDDFSEESQAGELENLVELADDSVVNPEFDPAIENDSVSNGNGAGDIGNGDNEEGNINDDNSTDGDENQENEEVMAREEDAAGANAGNADGSNDIDGEGDKDDDGEDKEIIAKEEDIADAVADGADGEEYGDDEDEDEDEEIVSREEDVNVDAEIDGDEELASNLSQEENSGGSASDNVDVDDTDDGEGKDEEITAREEDADMADDGADNLDGEDDSNDGEEISNDNEDAGSDAISGDTDTDDTDGGDDLPMPIEDESGSAEIEISFTPEI